MKLILILLQIALTFSFANAQDAFYYTPKGKVTLGDVDNEKMIIKFKSNLSNQNKNAILEKVSKSAFQKVATVDNLKSASETREEDKIYFEKGEQVEDAIQHIVSLKNDSSIKYASLIYNYEDGTQFYFNDELVILPKSQTPWNEVEKLCAEYNLEIVKKLEQSENMYLLRLKDKKISIVKIANSFYESGLFEFAEPNLTRIINSPDLKSSTRLKSTQEWHLFKTQTNLAWNKTTGIPAIKIAVIDDGLELTHNDLSGQLLPGYDCFGITAGGSESPSSHGTSCAGLIVGRANDICGTGISYNSKVIPIRISKSVYNSQTDEIDAYWANDYQIATAIEWAWNQTQADIISCSWGGGPYSSVIDAAFYNAAKLGRGGKGSLVLISAGNENRGNVSFPANLPHVISVGATNENDKRVSTSDWGSNWGADLDVIAPGINIYTIDKNNECTGGFAGTSAATPIAAGVMGLILSKEPNISGAAARYILESTCDKNDGYDFAGNKASGSWNSEVGYGRINALKALNADIPSIIPDGCAVADFTQSNFNNSIAASVIAPGGHVSFISTSTTNAAGGYISSYLWNFGDGATSKEKNPTHTYANEGTYTVLLQINVNYPTGSCTNHKIKYNSVIVSQQALENLTHNFTWIPEDETKSYAFIGDESGYCTDYNVTGDFVFPVPHGIFKTPLNGCDRGNYIFNKYLYNHSTHEWIPINKCVPGEWHASHGAPGYWHGISGGYSIRLISSVARTIEYEFDWVDYDYSNWNDYSMYDPDREIEGSERTTKLGEGMYYNLAHSLNPSKVYKLNLYARWEGYMASNSVRAAVVDKLNISLANGLHPQEYGAPSITHPSLYQMPSYSFTEYKVGNINTAIDENWRCIEILFIPPADGNLNQLWLYPEAVFIPRRADTGFVDIPSPSEAEDYWWGCAAYFNDFLNLDRVHLMDVGNNCISEITFNNNSNLPTVTSTSNKIIAQNNVKVLSGQDVKFEAGKQVILKPGFHAVKGSKFKASIKECESKYNFDDFTMHASTRNSSNQHKTTNYQQLVPEPKINYPKVDLTKQYVWNLHPEDIASIDKNKNDEYKQNHSIIKVYPNPNNGNFTIDLENINDAVKIEIFNLTGNLINQEYVNQRSQIEYNLTNYPNGIYFIRVITISQEFMVKLLKNK